VYAVRPAGDFADRARLSAYETVEFLEPGITIGLQHPGEGRHVRRRVRSSTVWAVEVHSGRWGGSADRPVIAHTVSIRL